jgi:hypothetical protein
VEARNPVEAVAIAERQGVVAELGGALDQVFGVRGRLEEGEGAAAAQLDVVRQHASIFVFFSLSVNLEESSKSSSTQYVLRLLAGDPAEIAQVFWGGVHGVVSLHLAGKLVFGRTLETVLESMLRTLSEGNRGSQTQPTE